MDKPINLSNQVTLSTNHGEFNPSDVRKRIKIMNSHGDRYG